MPRKKVYKKKRKFKKKSTSAPLTGFRVPNTSRHILMKITGDVPILQVGLGTGGAAAFVNSFPINHPTYYRNSAANLYAQMINYGAGAFALMGVMDTYKVTGISVKYFPNELDTRTNAAVPDIADTPSIIYCIHDNDDSANITAETEALDAGGKMKSSSYPQQWYARNSNPNWYNCSNVGVTPGTAVTTDTNTYPTDYASMKIYIPNLVYGAAGTNYYYGRLYVTWYVVYKGMRVA